MEKSNKIYVYFVFFLCLFFIFSCEKSSNNDQSIKTLKSLEGMVATIEIMDKHNSPFPVPYPGVLNPSYYHKMKLNYIEYVKLLTIAQTELNILKREKNGNTEFLKEVENAMIEFTKIGSYLPHMLSGTGYKSDNDAIKGNLGIKSYDDLVITYREACERANNHLSNAYSKL